MSHWSSLQPIWVTNCPQVHGDNPPVYQVAARCTKRSPPLRAHWCRHWLPYCVSGRSRRFVSLCVCVCHKWWHVNTPGHCVRRQCSRFPVHYQDTGGGWGLVVQYHQPHHSLCVAVGFETGSKGWSPARGYVSFDTRSDCAGRGSHWPVGWSWIEFKLHWPWVSTVKTV